MRIQSTHRTVLIALFALAGAREASAATVECENNHAACVVSNDSGDLIECECINLPGSGGGVGVTGGIDGSQWTDEELPEICESMLQDLDCDEDYGTTGIQPGTDDGGDVTETGEVSTGIGEGTTGIGTGGDDTEGVGEGTTGIGTGGEVSEGVGEGTTGIGTGGEVSEVSTGGSFDTGVEDCGQEGTTGIYTGTEGGGVSSGGTFDTGGDFGESSTSSSGGTFDTGGDFGESSTSSGGESSADSAESNAMEESSDVGGEATGFDPPDGWIGCSVDPKGRNGASAMMLLGLAALGWRRRRHA